MKLRIQFALLLLSFWAQVLWAGQDPIGVHPVRLVEAEISSEYQQKLFELGGIKDVNLLLQRATELFPDLRFIIFGANKKAAGLSASSITWRDARVTPSVVEFYAKTSFITKDNRTYGGHIGVNGAPLAFKDRPLSNHPLILLRSNAGRGAVFHELVHHIFDLWFVQKYILSAGQKVESSPAFRQLIDIHAQELLTTFQEELPKEMLGKKFARGVSYSVFVVKRSILHSSEEIEVVLTLIKWRKELGLTRAELHAQADYGFQNAVEFVTRLSESMNANGQFLIGARLMSLELADSLEPKAIEEIYAILPFFSALVHKSELAADDLIEWKTPKFGLRLCENILGEKIDSPIGQWLERIFR